MYLAVYSIFIFFYFFNLKKKIIKNEYNFNFYLLIFFFLFFIFNQITADQEYYNSFYTKDFFIEKDSQGYDYFFYNLASLIAIFNYPKVMQLILYGSFLFVIFLFSKKFRNSSLLILLFFPQILIIMMQAYPRQAWSLIFILISIQILFKFNSAKNFSFELKYIIFFSIILSLFVSFLFHYSALIFFIIFLIFYYFYFLERYYLVTLFISFSILCIYYFYPNFFNVYFIKLNQLSDFYNTRETYSILNFFSRAIPIQLSALVIIFFNFKEILINKLNLKYIDKFFFVSSIIYLFFSFYVLFIDLSLILILDRFGMYFIVIWFYFVGRFIFIITSNKNYQSIVSFTSLIYSFFYLLAWHLLSPAYLSGEFDYCFFILKNFCN